MKDNVIFYRDWYEAIAELPPEERVQAYDAVFAYAFKGETPTNKLIRGITALMRASIDRNNAKYSDTSRARSEAGKKGMAKRWGNRDNTDNKCYQPITNVTNITVQDKDKEQEHEQEQDKEQETKIVYPYQDIVAMWKEICPMLPQIKKLNDNRRQKIKTRLHEFGNDPKEWLGFVRELFTRVASSSFLCGENNHEWTCTFDWLFENDKNWVKVVEGNYDDNRGSRAAIRNQGVTLGTGEYIEQGTGRRTYGSGKYTVPQSAPPRPSDRHSWNSSTNEWILL